MTIEEMKENYKLIFKSDEGQIVFNDLQQRCHIFATTHTENTHETAFREGQRSVVLFLINMLSDKPPPKQETTEEE